MRLATLIVGLAAAAFLARLGGFGMAWLPGLGLLAAVYAFLALSARVPDDQIAPRRLATLVRRHRFEAGIAVLILLTLAVRLPHLSSELGHNPIDIDEARLAGNVRHFFLSGELLHDTVEHYPGLVFWIFSGASLLLYTRTLSAGRPIPPEAWPIENFVRAARLANVGIAVGIVVLTALIGRRVFGARAGLAAALLVALVPLSLDTTTVVRNDPGMVLAALAAVYFALAALDNDGLARPAVGGCCAGVAAAIKYSSVFAIVPVLITAAWVGAPARRATRGLAAAAAFAAAIAITNHFVWFDFPNLLRQLSDQVAITGAGHWAASDNPARMYLFTLVYQGTGLALLIAAAGFTLYALTIPSVRTMTLLAYPVLYMWFMTRRPSQFARWVFPLLPFAALAAVGGVALLWRAAPAAGWLRSGRLRRAVAALAVAALFVQPAIAAATAISRRVTTPTHLLAERWLAEHVQPGETVLAEDGWLDLRGSRFTVRRVGDLLQALRAGDLSGVDWVVVPETSFGDPALRALTFEQRFHASYAFGGNAGYDYEIYRTPASVRPR